MVLVILVADPALPGCNEAWDRFDVLKIAISCGTCLAKLFRSQYFRQSSLLFSDKDN